MYHESSAISLSILLASVPSAKSGRNLLKRALLGFNLRGLVQISLDVGMLLSVRTASFPLVRWPEVAPHGITPGCAVRISVLTSVSYT
jgi:hypothetical protein